MIYSGAGRNTIEFDNDNMQILQDAFSKANDLYIICMAKNYGQVTSFTGSKLEEEFVAENFPYSLRREIQDSFVDGDAENVIERFGTNDYCMYKGVAIRGQSGEFLGVWLCFGINRDAVDSETFIPSEIKQTTPEAFDRAIALVEVLTRYYFNEKLKNAALKNDIFLKEEAEQELEHRLVKNEVVTEILRIMESDDSFSEVSENILREASEYMNCSHACLLKLNPDGIFVNMITEWCRGGADSIMGDFQDLQIGSLPFMNGKPYTISTEASLPENFSVFFNAHNISAGIFLPIELNNQLAMYLCFLSIGRPRSWSVDDLKFANDIKRVIHTILVKRITKNSLASSYAALEAILENTGCGVAVTDLSKRATLYINQTFKNMFADEIDRLAVDEVLFNPDTSVAEAMGFSAGSSARWYDTSFATINWVDGTEVRLTTFYDITDLKKAQKKVEKQASEDLLTGLYNRQRCERDILQEFRFVKSTDKEFAVLMIDLDDFANINEGLGHENGDKLLKFIAHAINDISYIHDHCYRVGGDEFAAIVDHENYEHLDLVIKRISNLFSNPWVLDGREIYSTMSMGGVRIPQDASEAGSILSRLSIALHEAKLKGKNRFEFYDQKSDNAATKRIRLENAMRKSVDAGCRDFKVYYQPIMRIRDGAAECCGAEALVRWDSPDLGFVMPDGFISLAEYLGLIVPIGEHVLREACTQCKHWNDFGHPDYKVNVNLSVFQLAKTDIASVVWMALRDTGLEPHNLTLEVTESMAIDDMDNMIAILDKLRAMGCRIALDDFGTGYSSLNHIRQLPIDTIKIDQAFIKDVGKDNFSEVFVKNVAELADTLHMDVCVEGVENRAQLDIISKFFVNVAQGYLFDQPLTQLDFENKYI